MPIYMWGYIRVTGVTLDYTSISLAEVGQTVQLTATVSPNNAEDQSVTWSSSDTSIATVSNTGLVTCVTPGNCTITVTTHDGGFTATCEVIPSRIPSIYQEVEYIYNSSSGPRIDTGITPNQTTVNQIKVMNLETTGDVIYGYYTTSDSKDYRLFNYAGTLYWDCYSGRLYGTPQMSANQVYEYEFGNNYIKYVGGASILSGTAISSFTGQRTITLNNYNSSSYSRNRWYYVKIWNNGNQVADLVPCYRKQDGVIGMYDIIQNTFRTNQGSGSFSKGSDV